MNSKPTGKHKERVLSAALVRSVKEPGFYGDGNGLYLKVDSNGAKRWVQRLVIHSRRRDIALGSVGIVSLAEARELALQFRKIARNGGDPIAARKAQSAIPTFKQAAEKVHDLYLPSWRNAKHGKQWLATLEEYVFPYFGSKRVDAVTSADVLAALTPIWNSLPETARRVRQRIGSVLKWTVAQNWRSDNPAELISSALPKHDRAQVRHQKALPYHEVGAAVSLIKKSEATTSTKLALEFLVLTATRSGETRGARWSEIRLSDRVWEIPAERMKAKQMHRVPLNARCIIILEEAAQIRADGCDYVFPGVRGAKTLSDNTLSKLLRELQMPAVPHGFRSSFRDWAGEQTNFPREVCEFALAHRIKDKAEAAYARSDLFEKRRLLMDAWGEFLQKVHESDKVQAV